MSQECITTKQNLGKSKCQVLPQMFAGMITTPTDFKLTALQMATADAAKTALQDAIKNGLASRIYKWPDFSSIEDASEETIYEETALSDIRVRDGKYRYRAGISHSLCLHKAMFSHRGGNQRVFFYDIQGNLFGTELSDGSMAGFLVALINVEKLKISDGSVATKTPIYIVLKDNLEVDESGLQLDAPFFNELEPLTDVTLAVEVVDSDNVRVTVTNTCDGTPVSGLVLADFNFTTNAGAAQVPDTVTETSSGSGVYLAVRAANFIDGYVNLVAAADLSVDAYESTGAVVVNIP